MKSSILLLMTEKIFGFPSDNENLAHQSTGTMVRTDPSFAQQGKWTHYALSLTNSQLMMFISGDQVSSKNLTTAMTWEDLDDRDLYLGSPATINWSMGGNILLDEVRIYDRALSNSEISSLYGSGSGDLGIRPQFYGDSPFSLSPSSQSISFWQDEDNLTVSGLELSEINASGASVLNFDSSAFSYELNASEKPSTIRVSIDHGAINYDDNLSQAGAFEFQHRTITSVEDGLVAWYTFDGADGSVIFDDSGNLRHGFYRSSDATTDDDSNISSSEASSTSYPKSNAFDNQLESSNDKWLAKWNGQPLYIQYDLGTQTEIGSYAIYSQNADEDLKSPKAWIFSGSNDNSTWQELDSADNQTNWAEWEKRTYSLTKTENYQFYRLNFTETTGYATPTDFDDLEVWFDATDLDADGIVDTTTSGDINSWFDKSPNHYHAETANGTPHLNTSGGPDSKPTIEIRSGDYLPINGSFFAKDHFYVFRSPPANTLSRCETELSSHVSFSKVLKTNAALQRVS